MINHNYSFCSIKVLSSHTNACSTWRHIVKEYRLDDTGDHQRVTNLLRMKWLIHHITLLIGNHGTLGIHVCISETQYVLIFVGICSGSVYVRVCWKVVCCDFNMDIHIWMKPKQVIFLNFIVHFYTAFSPHDHLCSWPTFINIQVVLYVHHNRNVHHDDRTTT